MNDKLGLYAQPTAKPTITQELECTILDKMIEVVNLSSTIERKLFYPQPECQQTKGSESPCIEGLLNVVGGKLNSALTILRDINDKL